MAWWCGIQEGSTSRGKEWAISSHVSGLLDVIVSFSNAEVNGNLDKIDFCGVVSSEARWE